MLFQRVVTALLLLPIVFGALFFLPIEAFAGFGALVMAGCAWEWARLIGLQGSLSRLAYVTVVLALIAGLMAVSDPLPVWPAVALSHNLPEWVLLIGSLFWLLAAFPLVVSYPGSAAIWNRGVWLPGLMGLILFVSTWVGMVCLRANGVLGEWEDFRRGGFLVLFLFAIIWAADVGAYFAGRAFGRHKLAPLVSPGKTIEGFIGGLVVVALVGYGGVRWLELPTGEWPKIAILVLCTALASVLGDLFESMVKRNRGVKDSGNLLPGHGGLLDRLDSMLAATPVFALLFIWFGFR